MSKQVVNTVGIESAAGVLRVANNNINDAFRTLQNTANQLDNTFENRSNWNGVASNIARETRHKIFVGNLERSKVIKSYINTLEQVVSPGYKDTENVNIKLADKFM